MTIKSFNRLDFGNHVFDTQELENAIALEYDREEISKIGKNHITEVNDEFTFDYSNLQELNENKNIDQLNFMEKDLGNISFIPQNNNN
jgi:hypothetical protein